MPEAATTSVATDRPERVLIVGPLSPADGGTTTGGVATHVSDLARNLAALGWQVGVAAGNLPAASSPVRHVWGTAYPPVPLRFGLRLRELATLMRTLRARTRIAAAGQRFATAFGNALGVARAARDLAPDVVHYHHAELRPFFGKLAGLDAPAVITAHSLSAFRDGSPALQRMAEENLRAADMVVTVSSDSARAVAERVPGVAPVVVPNGIDVAAFAQAPAAAPWEGARPLVLYAGWLAEYKGVRDLVAAMPAVRDAHPGAVLAIAGPEIDITAEDALAPLPADAARSLGTLPPDGVREWMHAADVLVLPSRVREGQPRVLLEAMAAGTPIVAADVGGVGELLDGGRLGALVAPGDPAALAAAIVATLGDVGGSTAARVAAAREAVRAFDSRDVAARVADVYGRAIALHARPAAPAGGAAR